MGDMASRLNNELPRLMNGFIGAMQGRNVGNVGDFWILPEEETFAADEMGMDEVGPDLADEVRHPGFTGGRRTVNRDSAVQPASDSVVPVLGFQRHHGYH